jgi:hypothetical protein
MNNNDSWSWNWDKEKNLYETNLMPLQIAFDKAISSIPPEQRLHLGGILIDDLWDTVYRKNTQTSAPILKGGLPPETSTGLLRHQKRHSSSGGSRPQPPAKPNAGLERLALLVHHNCVLKRKWHTGSAFEQALSTIMMRDSALIRGVVGSADNWDYLANKTVEPVDYVGRPIYWWTEEYRSIVKASVKSKVKKKIASLKSKVKATKVKLKQLSWKSLVPKFLKKKPLVSPLGTRIKKTVALTEAQKLDFRVAGKEHTFLLKKELANLMNRDWEYPENEPVRLNVTMLKNINQKDQMREKLAIEFLTSARGQV